MGYGLSLSITLVPPKFSVYPRDFSDTFFCFETFCFFSIYLFYIICYYNTFQIIELLFRLFRLFRSEFQQSGAVSPMFFLESLPFLLLCSVSAYASASVSVSVSGKKNGMRKKIPTCLFVKVCVFVRDLHNCWALFVCQVF